MVVNFRFATANLLITETNILVSVSRTNMDFVERAGGYYSAAVLNDPKHPEAISQSLHAIEFCGKAVEALFGPQCVHVHEACRKLKRWNAMTSPLWSELNTRSRTLRDAAVTELKQHHYYQYPGDRGKILEGWKNDWKASTDAFPSIASEVFDATDCYALDKNTASVFHSMRVAEMGLRALASERRIRLPKNKPLEWGNWQEIIKALDDEIKAIGFNKAGSAKDAALEFYSGARADLNGFKDEYRNQVMHVRKQYDQFQAFRALTNVRGFMQRLSKKISYKNHRVRWGLR